MSSLKELCGETRLFECKEDMPDSGNRLENPAAAVVAAQ